MPARYRYIGNQGEDPPPRLTLSVSHHARSKHHTVVKLHRRQTEIVRPQNSVSTVLTDHLLQSRVSHCPPENSSAGIRPRALHVEVSGTSSPVRPEPGTGECDRLLAFRRDQHTVSSQLRILLHRVGEANLRSRRFAYDPFPGVSIGIGPIDRSIRDTGSRLRRARQSPPSARVVEVQDELQYVGLSHRSCVDYDTTL